MNWNLCWECQKFEIDHKHVSYKNTVTGQVINGTRNFCSDSCELTYQKRMDANNPVSNFSFVKVE